MMSKNEHLMDKGFKYLARDKDGALYAYKDKPIKRSLSFMWETSKQDDERPNCSMLYDVAGIYDTIQWEDEEPTGIETLKLCVRKPFSSTSKTPFGFHPGDKLFHGLDDGMALTVTEAVKLFHDQADFKDTPPIGIPALVDGDLSKPDMIQKPPHYNKFSFQPIDVIDEVTNYYEGSTAFYIGTVLKYLCRAPFKGKLVEDLKKANYYLMRAITEMEEES